MKKSSTTTKSAAKQEPRNKSPRLTIRPEAVPTQPFRIPKTPLSTNGNILPKVIEISDSEEVTPEARAAIKIYKEKKPARVAGLNKPPFDWNVVPMSGFNSRGYRYRGYDKGVEVKGERGGLYLNFVVRVCGGVDMISRSLASFACKEGFCSERES